MNTIPLSLYVHLPWCVKKCPYCDFNSHGTRGNAIPESDYTDALLRDLDIEAKRAGPHRLDSIFFGGGTPSLFSVTAIGEIIEAAAGRFAFAENIEITLEANPGTVEQARFEGYRQVGVNRLSIGVQSLDDAQLKRLGRIHSAAEARTALKTARAAGFDNLNLDLIYALPRQTLAQAESDIRGLCKLEPEHISYYQLTLEPGTAFAKRPPPLPDDGLAWGMHCQGQEILAEFGYAQYEVSAYAQPNRQSRHNLNYWEFGDYLGIGAGAHNKLTGANGDIIRTAKQKNPRLYMQTAGTQKVLTENRQVNANELPLEFAMNALRLNAGFDLDLFQERTGLGNETLEPILSIAVDRGLLKTDQGRIKPTALGARHLDTLLTLFLPEAEAA